MNISNQPPKTQFFLFQFFLIIHCLFRIERWGSYLHFSFSNQPPKTLFFLFQFFIVYSELKDEVLIYTFHSPCSLFCCSKSVHSKQNKHRISSTISFILHSLMMRPSTCLFVLIHMMILAGSLPQINIMSKYLHFYNSLF